LVYHPALTSIIQQLGGGAFVAGGGVPTIRWPEPEKSWKMPKSGHIDAYGASGWLPFMVGATAYLYDVEPKGGAFMFWPDSHHAAHRYFRQNPELVDGSFLKEEGFSWHTFGDSLCDNLQTGGQEFVAGAGELVIFCGAIVGAGLGFLWFNTYPAQVFMGDVGALALGAALGIVAVIARHEIVLFIMGGIFVMETVSVILQVASYKLTKKRIFRMAPIHHHFELKGWPEPRVIVRFWIITVMLVLFGLATLKLR
jgi:hypothetical protein